MTEWFLSLDPVRQARLAGLFKWIGTAVGTEVVSLARNANQSLSNAMLGFSGGVMITTNYWSLSASVIEISPNMGGITWIPAAAGFLLGGARLRSVDKILPHLHLDLPREEADGPHTTWKRTVLLVLAITLHNIPEGPAIGVAFGGSIADFERAMVAAVWRFVS